MLTRVLPMRVWIILMWSGVTVQVFGQTRDTIIGCPLSARADRPGFYSIREAETGFTLLVTGLDDLGRYTSGQKVRLTGMTVREQGEDLFRVSKIEQLSATCDTPATALPQTMKQAVERATFGVRGGVGFDPAIIYMGAHAQLPIVSSFWARPSYEFGFGEVTKINSLNLDGVWFIPVTARDRSTQQIEFWNVYVGAGLGIHLTRRGFEEAEQQIDFGDWDFSTGLNLIMGIQKRGGLFAELRAGAYGSPSIKLIVGFNFR
jgi:hypothetical protein